MTTHIEDTNQTDAVGIIGKNGAGKSTLLKVLSRVTTPTTGNIKVKGRIASLLEVGTGFHPELTGKENIYLNGAILGMRKHEIKKHFDAIVDFSGVERYIDTPVKRYSSGMYVRLAFAVAAHLESEILIVDEVLAVGDAEFQKKCLGKMGDVSKSEGRTVLFVSHNMAAVSTLCTSGILLKNGNVKISDKIDKVIDNYINENINYNQYQSEEIAEREVQILTVNFLNESGSTVNNFSVNESIRVQIKIKNQSKERGIRCNIAFYDLLDKLIFISRNEVSAGYMYYYATIPANFLQPNKFKVSVAVDIPFIRLYEILKEFLFIEIVDLGSETSKSGDTENGLVFSNIKWQITNA